jgi:predicted RNA binding protein YcfA (HicA-like mRNA interferase family)
MHVLPALLCGGWRIERRSGSQRTFSWDGGPDFVFAFHDRENSGPPMLAGIAEHTRRTRKILIVHGSHIPTAVRAEPVEA